MNLRVLLLFPIISHRSTCKKNCNTRSYDNFGSKGSRSELEEEKPRGKKQSLAKLSCVQHAPSFIGHYPSPESIMSTTGESHDPNRRSSSSSSPRIRRSNSVDPPPFFFQGFGLCAAPRATTPSSPLACLMPARTSSSALDKYSPTTHRESFLPDPISRIPLPPWWLALSIILSKNERFQLDGDGGGGGKFDRKFVKFDTIDRNLDEEEGLL